MRHGLGTLTWYGNIVFSEPVEPDLVLPPGQGEEASLERPPRAGPDFEYQGFHELVVDAPPGETTRLPVRFDPGWSSAEAEVLEEEGCLALRPLEAGPVTLRYRDSRVDLGLGLALLAALAWVLGLRRSPPTP